MRRGGPFLAESEEWEERDSAPIRGGDDEEERASPWAAARRRRRGSVVPWSDACVVGAVGMAVFLYCATVFEPIMWARDGIAPAATAGAAITLAVAVGADAIQQRVRAAKPYGRSAHWLARALRAALCGAALFVLFVYAVRSGSSSDLDDLTPAIPCDYLDAFAHKPHAKFLWVIPIHHGVPIGDDPDWCARLLRLQARGFVLGMHGVFHEGHADGQGNWLREFEALSPDEARERLELGVAEWRRAFNQTPTHFSFPGQWGTLAAARMVREAGFAQMEPRTLAYGLYHRIYHCDDSFCDGAAIPACKAWFQDMF